MLIGRLLPALALASVAALAQPVPGPGYPPPPPGYGAPDARQQFAVWEQQMIAWNQRFNSAPSGSWEEKDADRRRREAADQALRVISAPDALSHLSSAELESYTIAMEHKFNASPSGSVMENVYRSTRDLVVVTYETHALWELSYAQDWREALETAKVYRQKFNGAASGSGRERAYRNLHKASVDKVRELFDAELAAGYYGTAEAEALAIDMHQRFNGAPSGSELERVYREMRDASLRLALSQLSYDVRSYPIGSLYQLQAHYDSRFKAAASGSVLEIYYRQARDLVRSEINKR
jgi:hypothetical protein